MKRLLSLLALAALLVTGIVARADEGYPPNVIAVWLVGDTPTYRSDTLFVGTDTTVIGRAIGAYTDSTGTQIDTLNVREVRRAVAVGCQLKVGSDCEADSITFVIRPILGNIPVSFPNTLTNGELTFRPLIGETATDSIYTVLVPLERNVVAKDVQLLIKNANVVGAITWAKTLAILSKYGD